jgi:hypothetical protein
MSTMLLQQLLLCVFHGSTFCDTKSMCGVTPFLKSLQSEIDLSIQARIEDVMRPL